MSDNLVKYGYADGGYYCKCGKCGSNFIGAKRSWCCKGCAVSTNRIQELETELAELKRWQNAAFIAYGNIDLVIEANPDAFAELMGDEAE